MAAFRYVAPLREEARPATFAPVRALGLLVSVVTLGSGRTSVLQGAVHLVLFLAYVVMVFD